MSPKRVITRLPEMSPWLGPAVVSADESKAASLLTKAASENEA